MPAPRRPRLEHITVRMRVSVDPERWKVLLGEEGTPDEVRRYCVEQIRMSAAGLERAIVSARRDGT